MGTSSIRWCNWSHWRISCSHWNRNHRCSLISAVLGFAGLVLGAWAGSGSQNSAAIGKGLLKNNEVSTQFGRLFNAVNNYAAGTISKRGMAGVFNLYGKQFISAVSKAMPGTVARLTAINIGRLGVATIATAGIGLLF